MARVRKPRGEEQMVNEPELAQASAPTQVPYLQAAGPSPWLQGVLQVSTLLAIFGIIWQGGAKLGRIETEMEQHTKQLELMSAKVEKQSEEITQMRIAFEQLKGEIQASRSGSRVATK